VIDERGFVDGVKVAGKCSKANVLGGSSGVYLGFEEKRTSIEAEQAGLKSFIGGLVGGLLWWKGGRVGKGMEDEILNR
jgi:hypothetical protein